eukprot:6372357-Prymnesium_polylepis.1
MVLDGAALRVGLRLARRRSAARRVEGVEAGEHARHLQPDRERVQRDLGGLHPGAHRRGDAQLDGRRGGAAQHDAAAAENSLELADQRQ